MQFVILGLLLLLVLQIVVDAGLFLLLHSAARIPSCACNFFSLWWSLALRWLPLIKMALIKMALMKLALMKLRNIVMPTSFAAIFTLLSNQHLLHTAIHL